MAIDKLDWPVQIQDGNTTTYKNRVSSIQFGSGYEQINDDGPNSETIEYNLTFTGTVTNTPDRMNPLKLRDFLRQHVTKSFLFTPPLGEEGLYRVEENSITCRAMGPGVATVTANLKTAVGA